MDNLPHLEIAGMIITGLVSSAHRRILDIRREYERSHEVLQQHINLCCQNRVLALRILASELRFDGKIFVSPGRYICGEESALLEDIEGKRGKPPTSLHSRVSKGCGMCQQSSITLTHSAWPRRSWRRRGIVQGKARTAPWEGSSPALSATSCVLASQRITPPVSFADLLKQPDLAKKEQ